MTPSAESNEEVIRGLLKDDARRAKVLATARIGMDPASLITGRTVFLPAFVGAVFGMILMTFSSARFTYPILGAAFVTGFLALWRAELAHRRLDAIVRILERTGSLDRFEKNSEGAAL